MTEPPLGLEKPLGAPVGDVAHPSLAGMVDSTVEAGLEMKTRSQWSYARTRFLRHRLAMGGLAGDKIDLTRGLQPPTVAGNHWFGTDEIGRDFLSRVLYGIRTSEEVGFFVAVVSSIIGLTIGALAGYFGGLLDNILMRITDLILTLPLLAILLTAAALLGEGSQWRVSIILALFLWTTIARVVRGVFLSLREKEYVEAAKASGAGDLRIMFRHILPNTLGPVVVAGTLAVALAILTEAALSFLGFGIKPPTTSLGVLVASGENNPQKWWVTVFPGLTIVAIVLCINFMGDGLRDALDPQQRRVRA
jgi:ABC-type dipeptide/oligopeptide/nickel transport system permease subunit